MEFDPLKLENQLCFPLYACAKEIVRRYKPLLDPLDLTYTQYIAMMALWEKRELTLSQLGDMLLLDSGTLTPLVKKLAAKGYLERTRSGQDERALILRLTPGGEALREKALSVPAGIGSCLPIGPEDALTLHRVLNKVLAALRGEAE